MFDDRLSLVYVLAYSACLIKQICHIFLAVKSPLDPAIEAKPSGLLPSTSQSFQSLLSSCHPQAISSACCFAQAQLGSSSVFVIFPHKYVPNTQPVATLESTVHRSRWLLNRCNTLSIFKIGEWLQCSWNGTRHALFSNTGSSKPWSQGINFVKDLRQRKALETINAKMFQTPRGTQSHFTIKAFAFTLLIPLFLDLRDLTCTESSRNRQHISSLPSS